MDLLIVDNSRLVEEITLFFFYVDTLHNTVLYIYRCVDVQDTQYLLYIQYVYRFNGSSIDQGKVVKCTQFRDPKHYDLLKTLCILNSIERFQRHCNCSSSAKV